MLVIEKQGRYLPSVLWRELVDAGMPVVGVTNTETEDVINAVQIIVDAETVDESAIDAVCAAHDPDVSLQIVASAPQPSLVEEQLAGALEALPDGPVSKNDLAAVIATLRGNHA